MPFPHIHENKNALAVAIVESGSWKENITTKNNYTLIAVNPQKEYCAVQNHGEQTLFVRLNETILPPRLGQAPIANGLEMRTRMVDSKEREISPLMPLTQGEKYTLYLELRNEAGLHHNEEFSWHYGGLSGFQILDCEAMDGNSADIISWGYDN